MSKEQILTRIREAMSVRSTQIAPPGDPEQSPRLSGSVDELWAFFSERSAMLKTEVHRVANPADAVSRILQMRDKEKWDRIATHRSGLTSGLATSIDLPVLFVDDGYQVCELEPCPVGISSCEALIAQSGSVLVSPERGGGRALSILPPHHVVVARASDLLPDLPAAFSLMHERYDGQWPSFLSFITGPSRTGDIERILVLGAHGPKRLTVILIDEGGPE